MEVFKKNKRIFSFKRYLILAVLIIFSGIGSAISIKASVGVGAYDAMTQTFSFLIGIKIGTMGMLLNCACVLTQIIYLKKEFKWLNSLQIPISFLLGFVINYVLYDILGQIIIENYMANLMLLVFSYVYLSIIIAAIVTLDAVTFPLEGLCLVISKKTEISFGKIRQGVDIFCIIVALALTFTLSLPSTVREGTIIAMFLFGPLMNFFIPKIRVVFKKLRIL